MSDLRCSCSTVFLVLASIFSRLQCVNSSRWCDVSTVPDPLSFVETCSTCKIIATVLRVQWDSGHHPPPPPLPPSTPPTSSVFQHHGALTETELRETNETVTAIDDFLERAQAAEGHEDQARGRPSDEEHGDGTGDSKPRGRGWVKSDRWSRQSSR